ncbi:nuclear transport factor 2 family protein [Nocardia sp. NPDC055321]
MTAVEYPESEPDRRTAEHLQSLLDDLARREPIFHGPDMTREDFEWVTAVDFWETGASGQRYSRDFVWATIEQRQAFSEQHHDERDSWETGDFQLREIAPGTFLLTYTLLQRARLTRRLTVWQRVGDDWTILYHQGTVVADEHW